MAVTSCRYKRSSTGFGCTQPASLSPAGGIGVFRVDAELAGDLLDPFASRATEDLTAPPRPWPPDARLVPASCDQRAFDRHLARRRSDLRAQQIGDVEHVDHAFAERRHMRRRDVEAGSFDSVAVSS